MFALVSQLIVLVIMGRLLPKDAFGDMMVAFSLYRIFAMCIGTGLANVLLFHVAREGGDAVLDVKLHRTATVIAVLASAPVALAGVLQAEPLALLFDKPELAPWLQHMAPLATFATLNQVLTGSLDGRSRIAASIYVNEVAPNALRLLGLLVMVVFTLPGLVVAHVLWISMALPWVWEARYLLTPTVRGFQRWSWWDVKYAVLFTFTSLGGMQLQGFDIMLVGYLFSSADAGNYAFASRIATLYPFFHNIIGKTFTPEAARALHTDPTSIAARVRHLKHVDVIAVALTVAGVLSGSFVVIHLILPAYADTMALLVLFAIAPLNRAFYFGTDRILQVAGFGGFSMAVQFVALANLVAVSVVFDRMLGTLALPVAMAMSSIILNAAMASVLRSRLGLAYTDLADWLAIGAVTATLGAAAFLLPDQPAVAITVAIMAVLAGSTFLLGDINKGRGRGAKRI